eukprot:g8303.t1
MDQTIFKTESESTLDVHPTPPPEPTTDELLHQFDGKDMDLLLKEFFSEVRQVDRDNEVTRIVYAFKINPYEQLNLHFDATLDDVRRQYRKLSLLVHPDKCAHPQAREAFEILGEAQKFLLNEERRKQLSYGLNVARGNHLKRLIAKNSRCVVDEVRKEWRKRTKHDSALRVASALHEDGRAGVEKEYEQTDEFHYQWKSKARDVLGRTAFRKQRLESRIRAEETRLEIEDKEEREVRKQKRKDLHRWEKTREQRVGTWRDFMNNQKKGGKRKAKSVGELKPPPMKTNDQEKLYVQRCAVEQFRPNKEPRR